MEGILLRQDYIARRKYTIRWRPSTLQECSQGSAFCEIKGVASPSRGLARTMSWCLQLFPEETKHVDSFLQACIPLYRLEIFFLWFFSILAR
jgi:hypothetical protein